MHTTLLSPVLNSDMPNPSNNTDVDACVADPSVVNLAVFADPSGPTMGTLTVQGAQGQASVQTEFSCNAVTPVTPVAAGYRLLLALPDGALFPGSLSTGNFLSATVSDYQDGQYVALSPITTLVDAYMQAHPDVAQPQASDKVLTCLGLPTTTKINGFMFDTAHEQFDSHHFYAAADAAGGIPALSASVVADIDAGVSRSFAKPNPHLLRAQLLGASMVDELTSGLTKWGGAKVKGWLMEATGVNNLLKELGLFDEDKSVKQLAELTAAINALADKVTALPDAVAYGERLMALEVLRAILLEWNIFLTTNTASTPAEPEDIATWSAAVLASPILTNLHDVEMGSGPQAKGLISLLAKEMPKYYDGRPETPYMAPFFNQFNAHRQVQELALNYKIEATHARVSPNLAAAELLIDAHHMHIKQQRQAYPAALSVMNGVLDRSTGLIWARQMIVVDGYLNIAKVLWNTGYRLPTIAELRSVMPTAQARAALSVDGSKTTPQIMHLFGFEPDRHPDGSYKDFADLKDKGSQHPYGYAFSSECWADKFSGVANVLNLYDGSLKYVDYNVPTGRERTKRTQVPLLLVRNDQRTLPPYVYLDNYDPIRRTAQVRAILNFADGRSWDATKDMIWKVTGSSPDTVHISNGPTDSGRIQFREPDKRAEPWTVTGEISYWGSDLPGHSYAFKESVTVLETGGLIHTSTAGLVLAPAHKKASSYPFSYDLKAFRTENTGRVVAGNDYIAFAWSSSDPSVVVDKKGHVTVAKAPTAKKEIQIKVTVGKVEGVAYLVLMP